MTTPSAVELAIKYDMCFIPIFVTRTGIGRYQVIISPEIPKNNKTIPEIVINMNNHIERHIRQYPTEWFWLHQRWR
jgi:KDO2-lipid IV(A) lauroyltransferase